MLQVGSALMVEFKLAGQTFQALNGGPAFQFNEAVSLSIRCEDQAEVDRLWAALTSNGGSEGPCGWLKDKFGVSWQIVPEQLIKLELASNASAAKASMGRAMMGMTRLDVAALEKAFHEPSNTAS